MTESTALIAIETINPIELFTKGGVPELLKKITADVKANLVDIDTHEGREACRSFAYKIARSKTLLDDMGKDIVDEWKKKAAVIDKERKAIRDALDSLKDDYRKPLTDWESAEKKRVENLTELIQRNIDFNNVAKNWQSLTVKQLQDHLIATAEDKTNYQEFSERADGVKAILINTLKESISARQRYDADQAELIRLRAESEAAAQADREAQIARDAAAAAERKAAQDVKDANERAEKSERDRKAAEDKARQDLLDAAAKAEAIRKERERVEKATADQKAVDDARAANLAHRTVVHNQAVFALSKAGIDEIVAHKIVGMIEEGSVTNVTINY